MDVSVIIPAFNEAGAVGQTVNSVRKAFSESGISAQILVVDDASTDQTAAEAEAAGAQVIRHPVNLGYGNAILSGVQHSVSDLIALTDADQTYPVSELPSMVREVKNRRLDMLVGARQGSHYQGSALKFASRKVFKALGEFTAGQSIPDINSGLRVINKKLILDFDTVLCGGFSFTTTITLIAFLTGHFVDYRPVAYHQRVGSSKVHYLRDTLRAAQILISTILLFNPTKLFLLLSLLVLGIGAVSILLLLLFPSAVAGIVLGTAAVLSSVLILSIGFRCEQQLKLLVLQQKGTAFRRI